MKHITTHGHSEVTLVFYIKDHHLYPILDDHLKQIATKANLGGIDNLWKYMSDMKWSNKSSNYIRYEDLVNNLDELIEEPKKPTYEIQESNKPTLSAIENHVIILPPDTNVEPVIVEYITRSNYFVEYLHFDNNGRLDCFLDHKNNMYVLNNEYDTRKQIREQLFSMYRTYDFE